MPIVMMSLLKLSERIPETNQKKNHPLHDHLTEVWTATAANKVKCGVKQGFEWGGDGSEQKNMSVYYYKIAFSDRSLDSDSSK